MMSLLRTVSALCVGTLCLTVYGPAALASDGSPPGEPLGLLGYSDLDGVLTLVWQPPLDEGGSSIVEYRVYRAEFPDGFTFIGTSTATTFTDVLSADPLSVYAYRVTAVNADGEGAASGPCVHIVLEIPPTVIIDPACLPVPCRIACLWWPPLCVPC